MFGGLDAENVGTIYQARRRQKLENVGGLASYVAILCNNRNTKSPGPGFQSRKNF